MRHDAVTVFARTRLSAVRFTSAHPTPPSPPSLVARVLAPSCSSERKSRSAPRAMQMCGSAARLLSNRKGFGVISMRIARSRAKPERLRRALLLFPLPSLISMRLLLLLLPALRSWHFDEMACSPGHIVGSVLCCFGFYLRHRRASAHAPSKNDPFCVARTGGRYLCRRGEPFQPHAVRALAAVRMGFEPALARVVSGCACRSTPTACGHDRYRRSV